MIRLVPLVLCLFLFGGGCATARRSEAPRGQQPSTKSPLVVVLVVDQMRSQYLEAYGNRFTSGFRRLMDEGAWLFWRPVGRLFLFALQPVAVRQP